MRSSCQGEIIFQLSRLNDFSQLKQMMTQLHTSLISYINDFINVTELEVGRWLISHGYIETACSQHNCSGIRRLVADNSAHRFVSISCFPSLHHTYHHSFYTTVRRQLEPGQTLSGGTKLYCPECHKCSWGEYDIQL